jgi:hypothetical protein
MKLICLQRRLNLRTRHYRNATVHLFMIEELCIIGVRDASDVMYPVFVRRVFAVPFIIGGDVCVR